MREVVSWLEISRGRMGDGYPVACVDGVSAGVDGCSAGFGAGERILLGSPGVLGEVYRPFGIFNHTGQCFVQTCYKLAPYHL